MLRLQLSVLLLLGLELLLPLDVVQTLAWKSWLNVQLALLIPSELRLKWWRRAEPALLV